MGVKRILNESNFNKNVFFEEQRVQQEDRFLRGRQIAHMIYESFRVTGTHESILDFSDLTNVTLRGDDIQGFHTTWDEVLSSMKGTPQDHIIGSLYKMTIREPEQLKAVLALYDQEVEQMNPAKLHTLEKWPNISLNKSFEIDISRPETTEPRQGHWQW